MKEVNCKGKNLRRSIEGTAVTTRLVIHGRTNANHSSSIGTNIVLVSAELASLGRDTLKLLLGWSVSVTNLHR